MGKRGKDRVNWQDMNKAILDAIASMKAKGFTSPTVRGVYYVLGSANLIPLTDQGYKSLDKKMVEMRKSGEIPWGYFAVKRGTSIEAGVTTPLPGGFQATVPYVTPRDWLDFWIKQVQEANETYQLPRWYSQKNLVEVWVEKDGLLGATASWVEDLEVTVRSPQGYGAWEFINDSIKRIMRELKKQQKEKVVIIYESDLDASGKDIPRFIEEDAMQHFIDGYGLKDFEFIDLALSVEQVKKYKLPEMPDAPEVLAKMMRDPRRNWYIEEYGEIFTELDAFYALATKDAKKLIRDAVNSFFDEKTYEKTRELEKEQKLELDDEIAERVDIKDE